MENLHYGLELVPERLDTLTEPRLRAMVAECEGMIEDYVRGYQRNGCGICHGTFKCYFDPGSSRVDEHCVWAMMHRGTSKSKETCIPFKRTMEGGCKNLRVQQLVKWIEQINEALERRGA